MIDFHKIFIKLINFIIIFFRNGTGRSVGTERVRVGGRSVFRRTIFQKNRIRDFFMLKTGRYGSAVGTERVGRVGNPLGRQSLL